MNALAQARLVLAWDAEQVADRAYRQRVREVVDDIDQVPAREIVDQAMGDLGQLDRS